MTRAAGVAFGLVLAVVLLLRSGARQPDTRSVRGPETPLAGIAVADDAGPLREVLMHYVPELEMSFRPAYRDILLTLAPETRVLFVVRRQDRARLDRFVEGLDASGVLARRVRVVEIERPLGIWSKDRALVLGGASGGNDGAGGNGGASGGKGHKIELVVPEELRDRVRALLGRDVLMLGSQPGDVPRHSSPERSRRAAVRQSRGSPRRERSRDRRAARGPEQPRSPSRPTQPCSQTTETSDPARDACMIHAATGSCERGEVAHTRGSHGSRGLARLAAHRGGAFAVIGPR